MRGRTTKLRGAWGWPLAWVIAIASLRIGIRAWDEHAYEARRVAERLHEMGPTPASDVLVLACALAALWAAGRACAPLRRPVVALASALVALGPWLQFAAGTWMWQFVAIDHRCNVPRYVSSYYTMNWVDVLPARGVRAIMEAAERLAALHPAIRRLELASEGMLIAAVGCVLGSLLWSWPWLRRVATPLAIIAALALTANFLIEDRRKPPIEDWMRDYAEVDRVPYAQIPVGDAFDLRSRAARLSDGRRVRRASEHGAVMITNDRRRDFDWMVDRESTVPCSDGESLVVRESRASLWRFARCETPGRASTAPAVVVHDAGLRLPRLFLVYATAIPRAWLQLAFGGLGLGALALLFERALRTRALRSLRGPVRGDPRRRPPYRDSALEPTPPVAREAPARDTRDLFDRWMIVCIALQAAMPMLLWMLVGRFGQQL